MRAEANSFYIVIPAKAGISLSRSHSFAAEIPDSPLTRLSGMTKEKA